MVERDNGYANCELRRNMRSHSGNDSDMSRRLSARGGDRETNLSRCNNRSGGRGGPRNADSGCSYGCRCGCGRDDYPAEGACANRESRALMNKLQQLDFSIQETVLYLDAYPDDAEALAYYHRLLRERSAAAEEYERNCAPLTSRSNDSTQDWRWGENPWPWSLEFPGNRQR